MKILLVSKGDARLRRTWSGVPRIVLDRLVGEGHDVGLLNVFDDFWFHAVGALWNATHDYRKKEFETTRIGGWLLARAVRRAGKGFDKVVALTFALDARTIAAPVELIHDWTPGYFWKRRDKTEERLLKKMRHAARVCCLYPASTEYLLGNGVHAEYVGLPVEVPNSVKEKARCKGARQNDDRYVVFATPWHRDNYIEALKYLEGKDFSLDVLGMTGKDSEHIRYHGYLDKDDPEQEARYWDILLQADCVLALGRNWPGGSSIAEAQACGCRVKTRDWPDLRL